MSLDALADEITAAAKKEASSIEKAAKSEAKSMLSEAKDAASAVHDGIIARAEREAAQIRVETVASARQQNQKAQLIARSEELDATWDAVRDAVGSAKLAGRADMLKALVAEAKEAGGDMVLHPVSMDRKALETAAKGFDFGDDVEGLGGFTLESKDGSVVLDYRFDGRLAAVWKASLGTVTDTLFS